MEQKKPNKQSEDRVFESYARQTKVIKTDSDSSTAKRWTTRVTGPSTNGCPVSH